MWGHPSSSSNLWVCSWRTVLSSRQGISICHFLLLLCLWDKSALLSLIPGLFPFTVFLHCSFPKLHLKKKPHSLRDSFSLEVISPVILDQNPLNCHLKSLSFVFFQAFSHFFVDPVCFCDPNSGWHDGLPNAFFTRPSNVVWLLTTFFSVVL